MKEKKKNTYTQQLQTKDGPINNLLQTTLARVTVKYTCTCGLFNLVYTLHIA